MNEWNHIFKLDPAKEISDEKLDILCQSGTDAIMVGGTDNVTYEGVVDLLDRISKHPIHRILEISRMNAVTPGFDDYFIPMVLNSKEKKWMMDMQHQGLKEYMDYLDFVNPIFEGYCILNEEAKAFHYTNSTMPDVEDTLVYAYMAEHIFHLPIFYMEYSGTYGDPQLVRQVKNTLNNTLLLYGGGIENSRQAKEMKQYADVIIVGNSIYTGFEQALETVQAVKGK
ncbi:heptaprenylglyceryl phosphate synthase [Oceanobacillus halophilus]|uniref:Heptaprenylglyceryl phosphate synthase n=1 Tax=Oceanobacillus halophilus TaxID=930130 RepID=A0A495A667_9BACI|nr:heptaprenylglyceryl phosphate synthase [Oceanobacillus halophilus]RKQ34760.1 heptaprenylglyceryl phosphate synthase [Oceanobacillus halophilus]